MHDINWYAVGAIVEAVALVISIGTHAYGFGSLVSSLHSKLDELLGRAKQQEQRFNSLQRAFHAFRGLVQRLRGQVDVLRDVAGRASPSAVRRPPSAASPPYSDPLA